MAATRVSAREYLIAVLACRGSDTAQRRLALREEWRRARAADPRMSLAAGPAAAARDADEGEAFEKAWSQLCRGVGDPETDLRRWLDSPREDLRAAARRGTEIGRARERLAKLWPKPLAPPLLEWWLSTLVHAADRGEASRRLLGATLASAPDSAAAFGRFLWRARREFPGLGIVDPVTPATAERGPHARSIGAEAATGPFVWRNLTAAAKLAILAALLLFASGLCSQLWWTSSPGRSRPTVPSSPVPFPGAVP